MLFWNFLLWSDILHVCKSFIHVFLWVPDFPNIAGVHPHSSTQNPSSISISKMLEESFQVIQEESKVDG